MKDDQCCLSVFPRIICALETEWRFKAFVSGKKNMGKFEEISVYVPGTRN